MNSEKKPVMDETLVFLGKMSVSISHEIKNCLAIINENAGLLEDFSMMAEQGKHLDPARLKTLSQKVKKQVRRADVRVKNLNMLAHSSVLPTQEVDLGDTLSLMCTLAEKSATMKHVNLRPFKPERTVAIVASPFRLAYLIWLCFEHVIQKADEDVDIELKMNVQPLGPTVLFQSNQLPDDSFDQMRLQSDTAKALLAELNATLTVDRERNGLLLAFAVAKGD